MEEVIFKDIPEEVIEEAKVKYEDYLTKPSDKPKLTFEEFSSKIYELGLLTKELEKLEKELKEIENRKIEKEQKLEEIETKLLEVESEELLNDFKNVYELIVNDNDLTQKEKLDKLKAYYFNVVRNVAKEIKFLNNLNGLIKEQDSEGFNDVLLIEFNEYIKRFYG